MSLYIPNSCAGGPSQELIKVIGRKISAALSIMGSGYILVLVGGKWRKNKSSIDPYQRIMAMYSVYDILFSFFLSFMDTWMTPIETGWLGASGNTATCSIQGFAFMAFGYGSVMSLYFMFDPSQTQLNNLVACYPLLPNNPQLYQVMYALQVLLLVRFKWTPRKFAEKVEYRMHWFILVFSIIFGAVPLFFQGYNPYCGNCSAVPLPVLCAVDGTTECVRGNRTLSAIYTAILFFILLVTTLFCTVAMFVIYRTVYNQEKRNARYGFAGNNEANHSQSKRIRKSMLLYTSSFYICWSVPVAILVTPSASPALRIVADTLHPLMGFLNMLVFIQPKCVKYQKDHEGTGLMAAYYCTIFSIPIKLVGGLRRSTTQTDIDDEIGFGTYNEHIHVAEGEADTATVGAIVESQNPQLMTAANSAESVLVAEGETADATADTQLRG